MAWTSFIPTDNMLGALNNTKALALSADVMKIALYDNAYPQTIDTANLAYAATNEVTGTNWPATGVALASNALTAIAGTGLKFAAANVSVASTTIATAAYGCLIYDTTVSNYGIVAVYFGGTGYTTNNGTFGITWDGTNGIFKITLH